MTAFTPQVSDKLTVTNTDTLSFSAPLPSLAPWKADRTGAVWKMPGGNFRIYKATMATRLKQLEGNTYALESYVAPVVTPTPTPEPSTGGTPTNNGGVVAKEGGIAIGLNKSGALWVVKDAVPAGFPCGASGLGLSIDGSELVAAGAILEGALIGYRLNGATVIKRQHTAFTGLTGTFNGLTWTGTDGTLTIEQRVSLTADRVSFAVTLTNRGALPLADVTYQRSVDANPSDNALNTLTIGVREAVSKPATGPGVAYTSEDPRALFGIGSALDPRSPFVAFHTARSGKLDLPICVRFPISTLEPGASATLTFKMERR